jgi:hypothetical protein
MHENRDAYPEQLYAIAADQVRAMRDEQALRQARQARRHQRLRGLRATLRRLRPRE